MFLLCADLVSLSGFWFFNNDGILKLKQFSCRSPHTPFNPLQSQVSEFQEILFLNIISALIVGETRNLLWNATMVRRRGARQAFTPRAGGSS
jgi:hypothetical protein